MHHLIEKVHHATETGEQFLERFDYNRKYTLTSHILIFLIFSCIGWVWEILFYTVTEGNSANRGVLHGPWLPVYGIGATLSILIYRIFKKSPGTTMLTIMSMAAVVEYGTAIFLERVYHMRWWDYSNLTFQFQGRICLRGLFFFGICGIICIYILAPLMDDFINRISRNKQRMVVVIFASIFIFDAITSLQHPNAGNGITYHVMNLLKTSFCA